MRNLPTEPGSVVRASFRSHSGVQSWVRTCDGRWKTSDLGGLTYRDEDLDLVSVLWPAPTNCATILAPGTYPRLGDRATVSGVVVAADLSNGRDFDDPQWALLPDGEYRVTIRVGTEDPS